MRMEHILSDIKPCIKAKILAKLEGKLEGKEVNESNYGLLKLWTN